MHEIALAWLDCSARRMIPPIMPATISAALNKIQGNRKGERNEGGDVKRSKKLGWIHTGTCDMAAVAFFWQYSHYSLDVPD